MKIIDISQKICPEMPVYPGDPCFHSRSVCSFDAGDGCEVSEITLGTHCGTHVDAPAHMLKDGAVLEEVPLGCFFGPCHVLTITADVITEEMLRGYDVQAGERILLRTDPDGSYLEKQRYNPAVLSMDAAQHLAERKVRLIGIDSLSVEDMEISNGAVHRTLLRAGIAILEGLQLRHAVDEYYLLSAFPLALSGENGSPCRAVLIEE